MKKVPKKKKATDVAQELRNLGALVEDNNHKLGAVAEQYGGLHKDVTVIKTDITEIKTDIKGIKQKLDSHTEMIAKVATDVEIVKTDIQFIKGGLRKKVDYDEFIALEKRVALVESKVRR